MKRFFCFLLAFLFLVVPRGQASSIELEGYIEELKQYRNRGVSRTIREAD